MLNIYYGGENIEKEKFIFEHIKGRSLLLVPDQFSLQAERDAFFYLDKTGLMDLAVVDFSALGHKILKEAGGPVPPLIDKYGRHMLLTRILEESDDALKIYKGVRGKNSFVERVNMLISEMKRSGQLISWQSADCISGSCTAFWENSGEEKKDGCTFGW